MDRDPHSFCADADPTDFLNTDPDPDAFLMHIRIKLKENCDASVLTC